MIAKKLSANKSDNTFLNEIKTLKVRIEAEVIK